MRLNTNWDQEQVHAGESVYLKSVPSSIILAVSSKQTRTVLRNLKSGFKRGHVKLSPLTFVRWKNKLSARLKRRLVQTLVFRVLTYIRLL